MGRNITTDHINDTMNQGVAQSETILDLAALKKKVNVNDMAAYVMADGFIANPDLLLGQVVEIRKKNGVCPTDYRDVMASFEFSPIPVTGFKIDEVSSQKAPQLRGSYIVNKELSVQADFLSYLSAQLDSKSSFSLLVFDQRWGAVDYQHASWGQAIRDWIKDNPDKMKDDDICYIYVVSGFIQKNIAKKRYEEFTAGAKGGAYGININGKLSTSKEDYTLDIIFGLTPAIIKRPGAGAGGAGGAGVPLGFKGGIPLAIGGAKGKHSYEPTGAELRLFASATGGKLKKKKRVAKKKP